MSVPLTADEQRAVDRILGRYEETPDAERLYAEWRTWCEIEYEAETESEQLARVVGVTAEQAQHALDLPGTPTDEDAEREELWNAWEAWAA